MNNKPDDYGPIYPHDREPIWDVIDNRLNTIERRLALKGIPVTAKFLQLVLWVAHTDALNLPHA